MYNKRKCLVACNLNMYTPGFFRRVHTWTFSAGVYMQQKTHFKKALNLLFFESQKKHELSFGLNLS